MAARILLFQEDAGIGGVMRARLEREGYDVTWASTFPEAAPILMDGRTDLFLVCLPGTTWVGHAMLGEARRANPTMPILVVTSAATQELDRALTRLGAAWSVARGRWQTLAEAVRRALGTSSAEASRG